MILTEQDIEKALNQDYQDTINELVECADLMLKGNRMLVENQLSDQEYQVLQEGLWEKVKFGLSKLGRYKVGGKGPFSRGERGKIEGAAQAKIEAILADKSNEVIKKIDDQIKAENPKFPNNEKGEEFLKTVMSIAAAYDSIVAATKKKPDEEGYLPTDAANAVIANLAEYVKKFLDIDLKGVYTVMDSEEEKVDGEGDEELLTDEVEDINEDEAADTRAKLQAKAGDTKYDTKRMGKEGLKSNKLPMLLAGVGASLGAFSWLTNTEWFKGLFQETYQYADPQKIKSVIETKTQVLNDIKPGEGVYKLLGRVTNHPMDGNSNPSEMVEALKQIGGGDAHKGVDLLCQDGGVMMKPGEAAKGLHDLVNNPDQYDKLGDMFKGAASGTGKLAEPGSGLNTTLYGTVAGKSLTSLLVKKLPIIITKVVVKTGVKTGAGYAIAKGFGAVLGPIGIGLVAAGALVKLMRMKGLKQSRAKTLNDLLQSLQPIKAEEASLPPVLPEPPNPATGEGKGGEKNNKCNSKNLNEINKLLNKVKGDSQNFTIFADYMKDDEFRDIFFSAIADVNQSIKINKQPLVKTLAALRSQGLIEAPTGRQRKYLKFKLDFQNFMNDVFKLFVMLNKDCKDSQTHKVIKEFYKQLYVIATQGKNAGVKSKVKFDKMGPEKKEEGMSENTCKNLKPGMEVMYKGENKQFEAIVKKTDQTPGEVMIQRKGNKGSKGVFSTDCAQVKPLNESVYNDDNLLNEDANKDLRDKLFKKLAGNFSTFLKALNKLKPMEKGKGGKPSEEEIAKRREAKKGKGGEKGTEGEFAGSAPRTKPPELAHYDRGDNYLSEEITRIKRLMK